MPAYFTCPKCKRNTYGKNKPPSGDDYVHSLQCMRCGLKGIYWVATEDMAQDLARQLHVSRDQIAVGVSDSPIELIDPEVATGDTEKILPRLSGIARLEAAYSQGERTKAFQPGNKVAQEGHCEGQCLHWIRRVLQGGRETYKAATDQHQTDDQIASKQKKQNLMGIVAQFFVTGEYSKQNKEMTDLVEQLQARLLSQGVSKKNATPPGTLDPKDWNIPNDRHRLWNQVLEEFENFLKTQKGGIYAHKWEKLARDIDNYLDTKVKVKKRRFSNILAIKNKDLNNYKTVAEFVAAVAQDGDFREGTCALLLVGVVRSTGASGGGTGTHAIAAHFKNVREIYLFDPNLGVLRSNSLEDFRRTLETIIGPVWQQDLKWQLRDKYGYSLFRTRDPQSDSNGSEHAVPISDQPKFTAVQNRALGNVPSERSGVH